MSRACLAAGLLLVAGCAPKGSVVNPETRAPVVESPAAEGTPLPDWFPHAVDLRVHPATRYVVENNNELHLEVRVELLDQFNEPIKDVGWITCELGQVDDQGQVVTVGGRPRLLRFELEVLTAQDHTESWDPVARAYVLPLKIGALDTDLPAQLTRLWVTFRPAWPGREEIPSGTEGRRPVDIRVDW